MKLIAERIITETNEDSIGRLHTLFEVQPDETVEALMQRLAITGKCTWHYEVEVVLKLVKPTN